MLWKDDIAEFVSTYSESSLKDDKKTLISIGEELEYALIDDLLDTDLLANAEKAFNLIYKAIRKEKKYKLSDQESKILQKLKTDILDLRGMQKRGRSYKSFHKDLINWSIQIQDFSNFLKKNAIPIIVLSKIVNTVLENKIN